MPLLSKMQTWILNDFNWGRHHMHVMWSSVEVIQVHVVIKVHVDCLNEPEWFEHDLIESEWNRFRFIHVQVQNSVEVIQVHVVRGFARRTKQTLASILVYNIHQGPGVELAVSCWPPKKSRSLAGSLQLIVTLWSQALVAWVHYPLLLADPWNLTNRTVHKYGV